MSIAMQLNLKPAQLRLIVEVAESGQLQMAAAATSMTQPAASRMLAEIERAVGAPLFLRQPKGMELTEIGAVMVRRARAMLREMRSMAAEVQALREGQGGAVRVGAVTGPAVGYLVHAIRAIKRE
ncbi:MAG: LysR family transcriptional regulator, partial [Gemmobacter sp.]